jgi:hypothetical protein
VASSFGNLASFRHEETENGELDSSEAVVQTTTQNVEKKIEPVRFDTTTRDNDKNN